MATVALETVGCRLNQYETERMAVDLDKLGLTRIDYKEKADLYVLNTCTVTVRADADCRKLVNRAHRLSPDAIIIVVGCYVESDPDTVSGLKGVDLVVGNDNKQRLSEILREKFPALFEHQRPSEDRYGKAGGQEVDRKEAYVPPNRALIKVGDGCNQACSYCIVPKVRGRLVSRPADDIIHEIGELVADGYHEVVLTAVHIGRYRHDGADLADLIERILAETGLSRLRLSSIEPNEIDDRILEFVANDPRVCRHLHLPLQSGSDRILGMMRRPYTGSEYLDVVRRIKKANPDITIGCDVIVGFPGETENDFGDSLAILDSGYVDYGHIFSYSDRPGTEAADFPGKIHPSAIKERNRRAREIGERHRRRQMESQIGKILGVISEHVPYADDGYHAVSDNYLKVCLPREAGGARHIVLFMPTEFADGVLRGRVVD